jgi:phosphatidate cytidylyltransferase|tara:strand:+ start:1731 stop:2558 length:828 start_codon:yes stop_codon:yes gene_type:complete
MAIMIKQRLMTAAILIPLILWGVLFLEPKTLEWFIALVTVMAAWEWLGIIGVHDVTKRLIWVSGLCLLSIISLENLSIEFIVTVASILWLLAAAVLMKYGNDGLPSHLATVFRQTGFGTACAVILLASFWGATITLHVYDSQLLLYILVSVWLADTGGYFVGKKWGKRPLAKAVSPNKTWEGVWGALGLTTIWSIVAFEIGFGGTLSLQTWLVLSLTSVAVSIVGDLFESLFKRSHNIKDSGNLLPGHGGVLDRVDSLIAAVPIFVAGLIITGGL